MLSEYLKLFLILSFMTNFTESKLEDAIECIEDSDCSPGFSCMLAKKYQKLICAKYKLTLCKICLFYSNTPKMFLNIFPSLNHSRPICTLILKGIPIRKWRGRFRGGFANFWDNNPKFGTEVNFCKKINSPLCQH